MDFDGNSLDFVGSRAHMAFDPLKGADDGVPMVENEFNDESFNNMDAFSLGTGLGDTDQGLIDFANDDEVESIAAGPPEDQVTISTGENTATSSTSSPTSTWRGKSEKSLESVETEQKVMKTLASVDFDVGDGPGDGVQSEENGAVEVYDEDTRAKVTTRNNNIRSGRLGGDDQQPQPVAREDDVQAEDGEDEKVMQDENVQQSSFNGNALNRAAMRQLKSFSPSKSLDRSLLEQQQQQQQQQQQHPHQHPQNHQQERVSLEETVDGAIILADTNVFKLHQARPKWRVTSKTLNSGFLGESFDGQGESDSRHRLQVQMASNRFNNPDANLVNEGTRKQQHQHQQVTQGERMLFVSDDALPDRSDALTDDLPPQDVTGINNFIPYSGHREGLKVKRAKFKTHHDHPGHSIHHSSLYSSLPVPFVFSAIRPASLQGRSKNNHGVNDDRKKRARDVDLSEVHHSRASSPSSSSASSSSASAAAGSSSVSSNVQPAGRMINGQLVYAGHNSKDTLVEMASGDIGSGDDTAYHVNQRLARLGADFASASRKGIAPIKSGNNFNRLKRADSSSRSSSQQSPKPKIEEEASEGQSESKSKSSDKEDTSKASSSSSPSSSLGKEKVKSKSKSNSKQWTAGASNNLTEANSTAKPIAGVNVTTLAPLINLVPAKKNLECEQPAYLEFPPDIFGQKWRARGFVLVHVAVVCYMFYCLAVVCDNYFLPALEECAQVSACASHPSAELAGPPCLCALSKGKLITSRLHVWWLINWMLVGESGITERVT